MAMTIARAMTEQGLVSTSIGIRACLEFYLAIANLGFANTQAATGNLG
jgi:hypothetical protein